MVRNELGWDWPVAVAFSWNAAEPEPRSREDWEQPMDWTPPSLYLFEKGKEFWAEISFQAPNVAEYQAIQLDRAPVGTALGTAYLVPFLRTDTGERVRSFLVTVSFCWEQGANRSGETLVSDYEGAAGLKPRRSRLQCTCSTSAD